MCGIFLYYNILYFCFVFGEICQKTNYNRDELKYGITESKEKNMGTFFKRFFSAALLFCLLLGAFFTIYRTMFWLSASEQQKYVVDNGKWGYHSQNIYCESGLDKDVTMKKINTVYSELPETFKSHLKENWVVFVSSKMPFPPSHAEPNSIRGVAYFGYNIIWLHPDFTAEDFAHECGHVIDDALGEQSGATTFSNIYKSSWQSYVSYGEDQVNKHSVSNESEFFATLFSEYVCHRGYLKDKLPVAYTYMNEIANTTWSYTLAGEFAVFLMQCGSAVNKVVSSVIPTSSFNIEYDTVITSVENNRNIDLSGYDDMVVDTSCLSDDAKIIVEKVLHIANNPDFYSGYDVTIELDRHIELDEYTEATGFLMIYFGSGDDDIFDISANSSKNKPSILSVSLQKIKKLETNRVKYLKKTEKVLSTLKEGTETEKLMQVANYILDNSAYKEVSTSTAADFWDKSRGDCATYAIVFKQFANRLGIKCDLIISPGSNGVNHAYNRVVLKDGSVRYYDLTRPNRFINVAKMDMVDYDVNNYIWSNG